MIFALLELQFAEPSRAKDFQCSTCPASVQKLRRCNEDKEDFGPDDASFWPIVITKGSSSTYGFCPGKASRNVIATSYYESLVLAAETGNLWCSGGISNQPSWFVELASQFIPLYNELRFFSRAKSILGDGKNGSTNRQTQDIYRSRRK